LTQTTDFGFSVKKILSISNRQKVKFSYDIGKKFPLDKLSDDNFLHDYWIAKIELDYDLNFFIERPKKYDCETT